MAKLLFGIKNLKAMLDSWVGPGWKFLVFVIVSVHPLLRFSIHCFYLDKKWEIEMGNCSDLNTLGMVVVVGIDTYYSILDIFLNMGVKDINSIR